MANTSIFFSISPPGRAQPMRRGVSGKLSLVNTKMSFISLSVGGWILIFSKSVPFNFSTMTITSEERLKDVSFLIASSSPSILP